MRQIDLNTLADDIKKAANYGDAMDALVNHIGMEAFLHFERLEIRSRHKEIDTNLKAVGAEPLKNVEQLLAEDKPEEYRPRGKPLIEVLFRDWQLYCHREAPTIGAAVTTLAQDLAEWCRPTMNVTERECLARIMIKTAKGSVEVGPHIIEWRLTDTERPDMEYRVS